MRLRGRVQPIITCHCHSIGHEQGTQQEGGGGVQSSLIYNANKYNYWEGRTGMHTSTGDRDSL